MSNKKSSEHLILEVLSFYEPMSYAQIIFELKTEDIEVLPDFTDEQMKIIIESLVKRKLVKKLDHNGEVKWIKTLPHDRKNMITKLIEKFLK
jgi:hypothetical protein